jgi:hypothetical protein
MVAASATMMRVGVSAGSVSGAAKIPATAAATAKSVISPRFSLFTSVPSFRYRKAFPVQGGTGKALLKTME